MTERILVPVDGSPLSRRAIDWVATHHRGADVVILHVVDPIGAVYAAEGRGIGEATTWEARARRYAEGICADAAGTAEAGDCAVTTLVEVGDPARVILDVVEAEDVDHVVMGSHGRRGIPRLVLGSVAERVIRESPVPVTVVR